MMARTWWIKLLLEHLQRGNASNYITMDGPLQNARKKNYILKLSWTCTIAERVSKQNKLHGNLSIETLEVDLGVSNTTCNAFRTPIKSKLWSMYDNKQYLNL